MWFNQGKIKNSKRIGVERVFKKILLAIAIFGLAGFCVDSAAFAQQSDLDAFRAADALSMKTLQASQSGTLGNMIDTIRTSTDSLPNLVAFIAYMIATLFSALGVYKLKNHVEYGPQSVQLAEPLKYLGAGGMMFALPSIARVAQLTFGSEEAAQDIGWSASASGSGATLDNMMVNFMNDAFGPFVIFMTFFCFVAGAVLTLVAIHRFTKTSQEGPRGPTGMGTISTFVLAGVLFSIAPSVGTITETLFGGRDSMTEVEFLALGASMGAGGAHAENVVVSILAFMIIVGILSIIRGFFILRGLAEGNQQMTMMGGLSHIIAGAILVNFGQFANIIQNTLGITQFGVLFS